MRTIVMTGGSSGFGRVAVERMTAARPDIRVLLGARGQGPSGAETLDLDLARLDSVRSFAWTVVDRLGTAEIDALVLNAGRIGHADDRTVDGFEPTFAVNHLAHYLLARLLLPRVADGAVVVLTTSGTHDPAEKGPLPLPRHADARLLAHPELDTDLDGQPRTAAERAYTASKLCAVLTARALAAQPESRRLTVVAYCPGVIHGTRLMRDHGRAFNVLWRALGSPLARPLMSRVIPQANTVDGAAGALADLALGAAQPPSGRIYGALRRGRLTWPDLSELAGDDDVMRALWQDSETLAGLDPG